VIVVNKIQLATAEKPLNNTVINPLAINEELWQKVCGRVEIQEIIKK
jgi:hypothetical protein